MHIPGHNPYITEYSDIQPPGFSDINFEWDALGDWLNTYAVGHPDSSITGGLPYQSQMQEYLDNYIQSAFDSPDAYGLGGFMWGGLPEDTSGMFGYQGISPEISSALANIFQPTQISAPQQSFNELNFNELSSGGAPWWDYLPSEIIEGVGAGVEWGPTHDEEVANIMNQLGSFIEVDPSFAQEFQSALPTQGELYNVNVFDPESIASTLSQIGGFTSDDPNDTLAKIRAGEVKALTPEMIEKTTAAYYDPVEDVGRQKLIGEKTKAMGKAATGGFAGSGARAAGLSGAEQVYRGGYGKLLEDIMGMQATATEDVMDTIYGWQELLGNQ